MLRRRFVALSGAGILAAPALVQAQAPARVRISVQPGMSMMPLVIAQETKLVERRLAAAGLGNVAIEWTQISGGTAMNDALLSDSIDFASGGLPPAILLWEKTKGTPLEARALASMASIPQMLFARNPAVKTIRDFTPQDRIAVPALRVGLQAMLVQMAAAQAFGPDAWNRYENIMLQISHADAFAALSGAVATEITAHMSGPPQQWTQMRDAKLTRVFESTSVTEGPASQNVIYARMAYRQRNPEIVRAVLAALDDSMAAIKSDLPGSVAIFLRAQRTNMDAGELAQNLRDPNVTFDTTPNRSLFFSQFMLRAGLIKQGPATWRDIWMPDMHERNGS